MPPLIHGRPVSSPLVDKCPKEHSCDDERPQRRQGPSRGIEQVNQAVVQMDGMTRQNAALVEQAAAAAASLEGQARALNEAMSTFRLPGGA